MTMDPNLQNDLIEFKAWYRYRMDIIEKIIIAAEGEAIRDPDEIAQLRKAKLALIEKAAREIIDVYARYGYYPDL